MIQAVSGGLTRTEQRVDWAREVAATLALAWPMILSNLAGTALATMDLVLIGRLGPEPLAAAALATNLFHAVMISSIGLVTAVSPRFRSTTDAPAATSPRTTAGTTVRKR